MGARPKIIWPHPSPLHDWWTQVMASSAARLSAHRGVPSAPVEADHIKPEPESPTHP